VPAARDRAHGTGAKRRMPGMGGPRAARLARRRLIQYSQTRQNYEDATVRQAHAIAIKERQLRLFLSQSMNRPSNGLGDAPS
jgi:hypothetical protein